MYEFAKNFQKSKVIDSYFKSGTVFHFFPHFSFLNSLGSRLRFSACLLTCGLLSLLLFVQPSNHSLELSHGLLVCSSSSGSSVTWGRKDWGGAGNQFGG
jgi:hypothetical protein